MQDIIKEFNNWLRKIKNKRWKYNFIDDNWNLLSKI